MENNMVRRVLTPLAERLGTAAAVYLVSKTGGDASLVRELATAIVAISLVGADIVIARLMRSKT